MIASPTHAASYVTREDGGYRIRCTTSPSSELPREVLERYQIPDADDVGVMSCTVQVQDDDALTLSNMPAEIEAESEAVAGHRETITFEPILEQDAISYLGTYRIPGESPITFAVTASPDRADVVFDFTFSDTRPRDHVPEQRPR